MPPKIMNRCSSSLFLGHSLVIGAESMVAGAWCSQCRCLGLAAAISLARFGSLALLMKKESRQFVASYACCDSYMRDLIRAACSCASVLS